MHTAEYGAEEPEKVPDFHGSMYVPLEQSSKKEYLTNSYYDKIQRHLRIVACPACPIHGLKNTLRVCENCKQYLSCCTRPKDTCKEFQFE